MFFPALHRLASPCFRHGLREDDGLRLPTGSPSPPIPPMARRNFALLSRYATLPLHRSQTECKLINHEERSGGDLVCCAFRLDRQQERPATFGYRRQQRRLFLGGENNARLSINSDKSIRALRVPYMLIATAGFASCTSVRTRRDAALDLVRLHVRTSCDMRRGLWRVKDSR